MSFSADDENDLEFELVPAVIEPFGSTQVAVVVDREDRTALLYDATTTITWLEANGIIDAAKIVAAALRNKEYLDYLDYDEPEYEICAEAIRFDTGQVLIPHRADSKAGLIAHPRTADACVGCAASTVTLADNERTRAHAASISRSTA